MSVNYLRQPWDYASGDNMSPEVPEGMSKFVLGVTSNLILSMKITVEVSDGTQQSVIITQGDIVKVSCIQTPTTLPVLEEYEGRVRSISTDGNYFILDYSKNYVANQATIFTKSIRQIQKKEIEKETKPMTNQPNTTTPNKEEPIIQVPTNTVVPGYINEHVHHEPVPGSVTTHKLPIPVTSHPENPLIKSLRDRGIIKNPVVVPEPKTEIHEVTVASVDTDKPVIKHNIKDATLAPAPTPIEPDVKVEPVHPIIKPATEVHNISVPDNNTQILTPEQEPPKTEIHEVEVH